MPLEAYVPDEMTLRSFLLGRLSAMEAERVERYLEAHPEAVSTLEALNGEDTFTSALHDSVAVEEVLPQVQATMDRLLQVYSPSTDRTVTAGGTDESKTGAPSLTDEIEDTLDFLSPAQQPDELGRLGGYRVLRVLGVGGMGMVLEAEDPKLGRHVAIKVMLPKVASNAKARDRFVREARAAAKVEHDHIIPIYFIGEENAVPFIVMPFLRGESLDARLKREGRLPMSEIVRIGREVAEGLAAAHELGLVHRDIKPANLWLEIPRSRAKILDFGLARLNTEAGQLTQSGAIVGTPAYMAPEQARSQPVDGRSDLFSLGAVLYKMATGRTPFGGSDTISMLMSLANDTPINARNLNPDVPPALADLIARLLEKDPAKRPQSAREVILQLAPPPTIEAMPVSGERRAEFEFEGDDTSRVDVAPVAERPQRQRGPGLLIGVAAAVLLLILGGGFAGYKLIFETKDGMLIVEVDGDVDARFKYGELHIFDADGKPQYTLRPSEKNRLELAPGDYKVSVSGPAGVELDTDAFEMKKGGQVTIRVTAKPPSVAKKENNNFGPAGANNNALEFDGTATWVQLPFADDRDGPWTIEAWVRPGKLNRMATIFAAFAAPRGLGFTVFENQLEAAASFADAPTWSTAKSGRGLNDKSMQHVAAVFDGRKLQVYLGGTLVAQSVAKDAHAPSGKRFCLGGWEGKDLFTGIIDEVRFSKIARYPTDFVPATRFPTDTDTLALYHCDEGTGDELRDSSGNGHHAKIIGANWTQVGLATNPDRLLAEQAIKFRGSLVLQQSPKVMKAEKLEELPAGPFDVTDVGLSRTTEAELAVIANLLRAKARHNNLGLQLIESRLDDDSLKHLVGTNITRLALRINNFSDAGLIHLLGIKNLKSLVIHNSERVTMPGIEKLAKALPGCVIESEYGMFNVKVEPVAPESSLPAIELSEEQRKALQSVPNIGGRVKVVSKGKVLDIGPGEMLPAGPFATVGVNFKGVPIGDSNMEKLRHVPPVHNMLHLGSTLVTDEGLLSLAKFPGLAAVPLLHLQGSKVTAEGVKSLAAKLPKCTIVSDHGRIEPKS